MKLQTKLVAASTKIVEISLWMLTGENKEQLYIGVLGFEELDSLLPSKNYMFNLKANETMTMVN